MIYYYVKGGGSRFWLVVFNYFSLYQLKTMPINKRLFAWHPPLVPKLYLPTLVPNVYLLTLVCNFIISPVSEPCIYRPGLLSLCLYLRSWPSICITGLELEFAFTLILVVVVVVVVVEVVVIVVVVVAEVVVIVVVVISLE